MPTALDAGSPVARWCDRPAPCCRCGRGCRWRALARVWAARRAVSTSSARPALVLNLPGPWGRGGAASGEPAYLSLRRLLRSPPAWTVQGRAVFVCETPTCWPSLPTAWGRCVAPLVSPRGMPAAAAAHVAGAAGRCRARLPLPRRFRLARPAHRQPGLARAWWRALGRLTATTTWQRSRSRRGRARPGRCGRRHALDRRWPRRCGSSGWPSTKSGAESC